MNEQPEILKAVRLNSFAPETLQSTTVSKDDLSRILKENLDSHNEVFNAATQVYFLNLESELLKKADLAKALVKHLGVARENIGTLDTFRLFENFKGLLNITTVKPISYETAYKTALRKVELSVADEFVLSNSDFEKYILNNWEWKESFISNATHYLSNSTGAYSEALFSGINKFQGK